MTCRMDNPHIYHSCLVTRTVMGNGGNETDSTHLVSTDNRVHYDEIPLYIQASAIYIDSLVHTYNLRSIRFAVHEHLDRLLVNALSGCEVERRGPG